MKTRTLLLLSVTCGLAILLAGTIQLLRLAGQDTTTTLGIGDRGQAGDAVVVLIEYDDTDPRVDVVTVTLSGVDDPEGISGFRLASPSGLIATTAGGADECTSITVEPVTCTLTFPTETLDGTSRQLVFRRAEEQLRWKLK